MVKKTRIRGTFDGEELSTKAKCIRKLFGERISVTILLSLQNLAYY